MSQCLLYASAYLLLFPCFHMLCFLISPLTFLLFSFISYLNLPFFSVHTDKYDSAVLVLIYFFIFFALPPAFPCLCNQFLPHTTPPYVHVLVFPSPSIFFSSLLSSSPFLYLPYPIFLLSVPLLPATSTFNNLAIGGSLTCSLRVFNIYMVEKR